MSWSRSRGRFLENRLIDAHVRSQGSNMKDRFAHRRVLIASSVGRRETPLYCRMTEDPWGGTTMKADSEVIEMLQGVRLFVGLPDETLEVIASQMKRFDYPAGATVIEQDATSKFGRMYVILSGTADAEVQDEMIASLRPGDHFGEISMLDGGPRSATVVARSDLSTMGMSSWNMRAVLREHPDIAVHVIEVLAARLRHANERSLD